jgi:hypothetical protein
MVETGRFKTVASITSKLARRERAERAGLRPQGEGLNDALRYTFLFDRSVYTNGVLATLKILPQHQLRIERVRNYWQEGLNRPEGATVGVTAGLVMRDGYASQLMLFTPETFQVAEVDAHRLYERLRSLEPGPERDGVVREHLVYLQRAHAMRPKGVERIPSCGDYGLLGRISLRPGELYDFEIRESPNRQATVHTLN